MKKQNVIKIKEEVKIPGTEVVLEKGDKIEILKEAYDDAVKLKFNGNFEDAFYSLYNFVTYEAISAWYKKIGM